MGPEHRSESSGAGAATAVVAVLILLLIGVCVVGAGVWFFRVSAMRHEAILEKDIARAKQQEALARERAARALADQAVATAGLTEETSDRVTLATITIDHAGDFQLNDQQLSLADLAARLRAVRSEGTSNVQLLIQIHEDCRAAHILDVLQVCSELGMDNFRLTRLDGQPAAEVTN